MITPKLSISQEIIKSFCTRWLVTEFALFGSVLRDDFHAGSDVDVLVSFSQKAAWSLWDLAEMQVELEGIFGRPVDLVENGAVRNPFRRQSIMSTKEVLYAVV